MAYEKSSFLEHTAIRVKDLQWHIRFFKEALGDPVRSAQGPEDDPVQVWTKGGVQLVADKDFDGPEGRMVHLGIRCDDLEAVLDEVYRRGCTQIEDRPRNWVRLPDGLELELMQVEND